MGYADAKADGIRIGEKNGAKVYYPRCFFCLSEVETCHYMRRRRIVCSDCQPLKKTLKKYYSDQESRTLFEAIDREAKQKQTADDGLS